MIERRIVIGLITSTEYLHQVRPMWDARFMKSDMANKMASWCVEFYDTYKKAPNQDIENIYYTKLKGPPPLEQDVAEEMEEVFHGLSDEYEREKFNVDYLLKQTREYFKERSLTLLTKDIESEVQQGNLSQAELLASRFSSTAVDLDQALDLGTDAAMERLEYAFTQSHQPLIEYPRALGEFMNNQLVRGGFIGFMGREKRGKTYRLLDLCMMGFQQGANVSFFQAGDMADWEQLIRISEYLTGKNHLAEYAGEMFEPVRDCLHNQRDTCDEEERPCDFGIFSDKNVEQVSSITQEDLITAYEDNRDYHPCTMCREKYKGVPWLKVVNTGHPLTFNQAKNAFHKFFHKGNRRFKLDTYPTRTLTCEMIHTKLDIWEHQEDFVSDVITVDYADVMTVETRMDFRHAQDAIWAGLRGMSQKRHALVVTATQADAASYEKGRLRMTNFSEDKRKIGHVTVMYGLNQDPKDRETEIGLMRINEIGKRKGASSNRREVTVLQNLSRGRPFLSSYW